MKLLIHDYGGYSFPIGLSRELARRGHAVTHAYATDLLTPQGALARRETDAAGLQFRPVRMSPRYRADKYNFIKRRSHEVAYGRQLAALVGELRPDLVLSGNTPTEPQWSLIRTAGRNGVPVITWLQDFYSVAVAKLARRKMPLLGALAGAWYRRLDARCLQASAGVVAITEGFQPLLAEFGVPRRKVTVIPNWASLDELPEKPRDNSWSQRHALADRFVFLYSGTLAMKHDPDLLRQLALAFRGDPTVQVVVVSEGPGADFLSQAKEAEAIGNLTLLPFQPPGDVPEVLATADVCVSILEPEAGIFSVPSKVLTYHAAGKPVLASIPAENLAAKIIQQEGSGICVEPGQAGAFLAAAAKLREDAATRRSMGANAKGYARREFPIDRIADQFEQCFQQALKSGG